MRLARSRLWPLALVLHAPAILALDADIRDIRGPKPVFPLWQVLGAAAALLIVIVAAYLIWRRLQRRPAKPLTPAEIALARLDETRALMARGSAREFSIAISDVVRVYIEASFDVTATHQTTEEFLRGLLDRSSRALAAHRDLLAHFLAQCDMAKFAGVSLSTPMMEQLLESARDFVIQTSKSAPPEPSLEPGPVAPV